VALRIRTFAEPCAGDGALVRHLESHGLRCAYAGDIATGQDTLALEHYGAIDAYQPQRSDSRTCSNARRQRAYREQIKRNAAAPVDGYLPARITR
jgi:hypothetical protein